MDLESEVDGSPAQSAELLSINPQQPDDGLHQIAEEDEKIMKTFGNHVVVENIMEHLDHGSIKYLGATCNMLQSIVRGNSGFIHRSKFVIAKSTRIRQGLKPTTLRPSNFPWKHVVIRMTTSSKKNFKAIARLLSRVESLELFLESEYYCYASHLKGRMTNILKTVTNIKRLTIGGEVLDRLVNITGLIPEEFTQIKENLKKLESLNFTNGLQPQGKIQISRDEESLGKIVTILAALPAALTSFTFERIHYEGIHLTRDLVSILEQHKASLRKLVLDGCIWNYNFLDSIVFPNLKELSLVAKGSDMSNVVNFLAKQPPLEGLSLTFEGATASGLPLKSPLLFHGPHLKRFSLTWRLNPIMFRHAAPVREDNDNWDSDDSDDAPSPPPPNPAVPPQPAEAQWDFSILQNFGRLEELKVHQVVCPAFQYFRDLHEGDPRISTEEFLSFIPDGIRKLDLSGAAPRKCVLASSDLTIESLGRFRHLKVLNLVLCPTAVDDKVLAYICSNLKQLHELGFSHCDELTDVGLTGVENGILMRPGLKSLTALTTLRILCCEFLTSEALLEAISFPDLRELTLIIDNLHQDLDFFVKLGAQNKSLEVLEIEEPIASTQETILRDLGRTLKTNSQRFRTLAYTVPPPRYLKSASDDEEDEDLDGSDSDFSFGMDGDHEHDDYDFDFGSDDAGSDDYDLYHSDEG